MVVERLQSKIRDADYFLCTNETCHIAYYGFNVDFVITKEEIKVPIWFKEGADPKYSCYCNRVTENEIIDAVKNKSAENMKDIINLTGAMKNGNCEINHPMGKCCNAIIQKVINQALDKKKF